MTPVSPPPLDVVDGFDRRMGEAVRRNLDAYVAEIPFYRAMPEELLNEDVAVVCGDLLAMFVRTCREGRVPRSRELTAARAGAARRAEDGVPLDALLMAYSIGNRVTWQMLTEQLPAGAERVAVGFTPYLQHWLQAMVQAVTEAYVEESRLIEHGSLWRTLVHGVLAGTPDRTVAERLGLRLAAGYLVVAVHLDLLDPLDPLDRPAGDVATRLRARRMRAALDGTGVLAQLDAGGGMLLVPAGAEPPGHYVTAVGHAAGAAATAVAVPAERPAAVPDALALATQLLGLARTLRRPPGTYLLDDLALEHQMSIDSPARGLLARQVRPLLDHPDLLPTVRCWLAHDRNRGRTADELHIHPNTLDKRLHRVGECTGIDLPTTRGVALLQAALIALDIESQRDRPV
jgi:hypothetical protein